MVNFSLLQGISSIETKPYPHIARRLALPADLYRELASSFPSIEWMIENRKLPWQGDVEVFPSNTRFDITVRNALAATGLPEVWRSFLLYHTSTTWWHEIVALFGATIERLHPKIRDKLGPLCGIKTRQRRHAKDRTGLDLDASIGFHTPVLKESRILQPHLDSPLELFSLMFYMADEDDDAGSDFEIRELATTTPHWQAKARLNDDETRLVKTVPYGSNTMVMFINCPQAIHSVQRRKVTNKLRKFVCINGDLPFLLFRDGQI